MIDKNINLLENEAEKLRFTISMLPSFLGMHALPESKSLVKKVFYHLPKKPIKQKIKIANFFNDLMTTQKLNNISMSDINFVEGEMSQDSYQVLLRSMGAECFSELYEHAQMVDSCINEQFNKKLVDRMKFYLESKFDYKNNDIEQTMSPDDFYTCLILSFIAHLDVCIHYSGYSEIIKPISLGWLFMYKPDPNKWKYDSTQSKYILINENHSPYTKPSRSFLELLQTISYFHTNKEMPNSIYGIDHRIDWKTDDPDGKLDDFIRRKKEGKWISLKDVFWLFNFSEYTEDEPNKMLEDWQKSYISYIKTGDITKLSGLLPSLEGILWFVYAFFQLFYIEYEKRDKLNKERSCIFYPEYYDLWQSITNRYESDIEESVKDKRIEWPDYLKKQATPL